jgi:histidine kinase
VSPEAADGIPETDGESNEYQRLFELVPCYITVQDKNLRLVKCNREFAEQFNPKPGAYCYEVYKERSEKCDPCPVVMTFEDGASHSSEEMGVTRENPICYRIVRTAAIRNSQGEITKVMQMSLDITEMRRLQEEIRKSEEKYRSIFDNIPNPVFILDKKSLKILDCNRNVEDVYGYGKDEILQTSFLSLFEEGEQQNYALEIRSSDTLNHARQVTKDGRSILVNIRISPYEFMGRHALLVSSSDIIRILMVKQQLIQASKMATLGEMATGIAHELNQPLSVIKTASSFILNRASKRERIRDEVLKAMIEEIDGHVDRASSIITHVREFGRKSEAAREMVPINAAMKRALDIFIQQLKLRDIEVVRELAEDIPPIMADANRLEQVFINLLINARDAIEEKREKLDLAGAPQKIMVRTSCIQGKVRIEIEDTGIGIPKVLLDRIFEPFFTTKQADKGTGLGLSISYGIVQDYHGTLQVEAVENEGSTFIIQFPVQVDSNGG